MKSLLEKKNTTNKSAISRIIINLLYVEIIITTHKGRKKINLFFELW